MLKASFHPKAFLERKGNKRSGLATRTLILNQLENKPRDVKGIMAETGLKYAIILYHLRLLEAEKIIARKSNKKPYVWELTGAGQKQLI